jgi:hypothetical protein
MGRGPGTLRSAALIFALLTALPTTGQAAKSGGPPYDDSATSTSCSGIISVFTELLVGVQTVSCPTTVTADKSTGAVAANAELTGVDMFGSATGLSSVIASRTIKRAATQIPFAIAFHVNAAEASASGLVEDLDSALCGRRCLGSGGGSVFLVVTVIHGFCGDCSVEATCSGCSKNSLAPNTVTMRILPPDDPDALPTGDFVMTLTLVNPNAEAVPAGPVRVTASVGATASQGFSPAGTWRAGVDALVTSITQG